MISITEVSGKAAKFAFELTRLVRDSAVRSKGIHDGIQGVVKLFEERLDPSYKFDDQPYRDNVPKLLRLFILSRLIDLLGLAVYHEEIMLYEIEKLFSSPNSRLNPRTVGAQNVSKHTDRGEED